MGGASGDGGGRILVVGPGRSGTTWIGRMVAVALQAAYVHEPDNPVLDPVCWAATRRLGNWPALAPGETAPDYAEVWDLAFAGGWTLPRRRRVGRALGAAREHGGEALVSRLARLRRRVAKPVPRVVAKSAFGVFAAEWTWDRYRPAMVLTTRNPLNIVASWRTLKWTPPPETPRVLDAVRRRFPDMELPPRPAAGDLAGLAWWIGLQQAYLARQQAEHPGWLRLSHDALCRDAEAELAPVLGRLGGEWSPRLARYISDSDAGNDGDHFSIRRATAEQPDRWKQRLQPGEAAEVAAMIARFGLGDPRQSSEVEAGSSLA